MLVKDAVPEIVEEINKQQGLLHFEIEVMCRRAQKAIYANDVETLITIFTLALNGYLNGNKALKNAIDVSFVEPLQFRASDHAGRREKTDYSWAWLALPEPLKELYIRFHGEVGT